MVGVDLYYVDCVFYDELFEYDVVLVYFVGGDLNWCYVCVDFVMVCDVVGVGWFFDELWLGKGQFVYLVDGLIYFLDLIGVDYQVYVWVDFIVGDGQVVNVVFQIVVDFYFDVVKIGIDCFVVQVVQFGVVIVQLVCVGGIVGIIFGQQGFDVGGFFGGLCGQEFQCLFWCDVIGEIVKVDVVYQFGG